METWSQIAEEKDEETAEREWWWDERERETQKGKVSSERGKQKCENMRKSREKKGKCDERERGEIGKTQG